MGEKCDWPCWEIMNCDESRKCPAKTHPETPCWELASQRGDYRYLMEICPDCIVRLLKEENTVLSKNDVQSIMTHKASCLLANDECMVTF